MANVKITMLNYLRELLLPDYCCSCGEIGGILCQSCKYDISSEQTQLCMSCLRPVSTNGRCHDCHLPYSRAYFVGMRDGALANLISLSKFDSVRSGCDTQAELIAGMLPKLSRKTVFIPVPTIARHVRQRGYGHAERIARRLARIRGVGFENIIGRREQYVQRGASRKERMRQASKSYFLKQEVQPKTVYVVVDDVYTTGATVSSIASLLRDAGADDVWVAVTSRQPIDATD